MKVAFTGRSVLHGAAAPPGQLTAADYRRALFTMVGVLAIGFVANLLVRPVSARFHEPAPERSARADEKVEAE